VTTPVAGPVCPNGHASDEPDYCSVCGAPMPGGVAAALAATPGPAGPAAAAGDACPSCGTVRGDPDARFCEVCRYDFASRAPGPPPTTADPPRPAPPSPPPPSPGPASTGPAPAAPAGRAEWEVAIVVDPSLDTEPDPALPPPADVGERTFPIDLPEMLVGRRDDRNSIRPEIPVLDPGVSRRHATFLRLPDARLAITDLASANGTAVNGVAVAAGERRELNDGDVVTIGRWTRITVRRRQPQQP
jgi:hypothetical protein